MTMEQRAWITIENFPDDEAAWSSLLAALDSRSGEYGPVLGGGDKRSVRIVMSADIEDRAEFARLMVDRVVDALRATGMENLYPSAIEIESIEDVCYATV